MTNRIRRMMNDRDQGFTLIELLVVIIIIGILAAIAIPVFLNQRKKGVDASLKADLKSLAIGQETWITDNPSQLGTTDAAALTAAGFKKTPGSIIYIYLNSVQPGYCLIANAPGSSAVLASDYIMYDSAAGGLINGGKHVNAWTTGNAGAKACGTGRDAAILIP